MYSIGAFGEMIADRVRLKAHSEALRATVKPGAVVLDIGTGTGILALLACRYGARKVYAVEPSEAIGVAREAAGANGFADRIVLLQRRSTDVMLEERADVIVSDMRGVLPPFQRHFLDIMDARQRLLAAGGKLVPRADALFASVVDAPKLWRSHMGPWEKRLHGIDLRSARRFVANTWYKARVSSDQLLTPPLRWARLDYLKITDARVEGCLRWRVEHQGVGHGLAVWFDADLAPGVGFSNAPGQPRLIYGQAFFPWPEPVVLGPGDIVDVSLQADLVGEDYVWTWESSVKRPAHPRRLAVHFRQSTFLGTPLTPETLARRASTHRTKLGGDGLVTRSALELMDGETPLAGVASTLEGRFPGRFRSPAEALAFVADLSSRYGE